MAGTNAKTARNNEIKRLAAEGLLTEEEIGMQYGITQSRINAIVHNRRPMYRYCRHCGKRVKNTISVCLVCRKMRFAEREKIRKGKQELRLQKRTEYYKKLLDKETQRVKLKLKKRILRAMRLRLSQLKHEENQHKKLTYAEIKKSFLFEWQTEGRDKARFLVRLRDDFACLDCGFKRTPKEVAAYNKKHGKGKMKSLDVHHLNGMCGKNSLGYDSAKDISGMITLCHKCHFNRPEHGGKVKRSLRDAAKQGISA